MRIKDIQIDMIVVGAIRTNCYIIHKQDSNKCIVVDPGEQADVILEFINDKNLIPEGILLTHGHFDHIMAAGEVAMTKRCPIYACDEEDKLLRNPTYNCSIVGAGVPTIMEADRLLSDQEVFELAGMKIKVLHTPGHTGGSCCYYFEEGFALSGDTVFLESVGRTDLPTGNDYLIVRSIEEKVMTLPEETILFPGHGSHTNVGYEKKNNPYL